MHHCGQYQSESISRRQMLSRCAQGFGAVALTALAGDELLAGVVGQPGFLDRGHHPARARSVIFLYMDGGPSQVDTFDPKPALTKWDGKPFPHQTEPTQFNSKGNTLKSPWEFDQHGECGHPISALFPHVAEHADDLMIVRSMTSEFSEHTNANYFLHTGLGLSGRPSMGAWVSYGLGAVADDLPGFVVINGGLIPPGGLDCFSNAFLPAKHQGSIVLPRDQALANVEQREGVERQLNKLDLLAGLDRMHLDQVGDRLPIEGAIANGELAFRMQSAVPEVSEISGETEETREMYGLNHGFEPTRTFGRECLLARRLVERGVRFVELTCPSVSGDRWDQHGNLKQGHENNARAVDQPIGALLTDLKRRGMLEDTLVVWSGEFGRTPFAQGRDGRDHNPYGYSFWMAGGGVKAGSIYGATDEFGYRAVENPVEIYDFHATMLHLLGVDHRKLTRLFGGREHRLTDVHGRVIEEWLA
ncbi:MAG: DUF1501 domain-containing protein [Planctomycetota bacterium]|nr:DUF1501 domain-containing protein [Planctomycetota bacterium]